MNNKSFRRKYTFVLLAYTLIILILWLFYHSIVLSYTQKTVNDTLQLESARLTSTMETKFSNMKISASLIGSSTYLKEFLTETDTTAYYEKAATVHEIISKVSSVEDPFDSVITINNAGEYYRFVGSMSNQAIERIVDNYSKAAPFFTIVSVDEKDYFCYISPVYSTQNIEANRIGDVIIINSLAKTRRILISSDIQGIDTAVVSQDKIIISTNGALEGRPFSEMEQGYRAVYTSAIDGTNLTMVAAVEGTVFDTPNRMFQVVAILVGILFLVILTILYRYLSQVIINPLLTTKEAMQMGLLGTQMDAHFVVNTLHTIEILLQKKELTSAEQVTNGLTEILKHQHGGMSNVFAELLVLEHYIGIMNIRYHQKFTVNMDVNEELAEYVMQGFLLQPIIENAFSHGFSRKNEDCVVTLTGSVADGKIIFTITDNGIGIEPDELSVLQKKLAAAGSSELPEQGLHGVALLNVQKRIQAKHGAQYGVFVESMLQTGTAVTLCLPAIKEETAKQ